MFLSKEKLLEALNKLKNDIPQSVITALKNHLAAKALVETMKPTVEKIQSELMEKHQPHAITGFRRGCVKSKPIDNWEQLYLASKDVANAMYRESREKLLALGFTAKEDCCPYLSAESLVIDTDMALVNELQPFTGIGNDHLLFVKHRKKYNEIILTMLITLCESKRIKL